MDAVPLTGAWTVHPNNDNKNFPDLILSETYQKYQSFKRQRMISARDTRDGNHQEFDDMPFLIYYDLLKKADDQYVAPRKNAQDTSINLGTVRDKDTALLEYAMKYDFEAVAQAYDDTNEMLEQMSEVGEDLVRKSKLMEDYRAKAKLIYRSMIAFGTAMVEDMHIERWQLVKDFANGLPVGSVQSEWTERKVKIEDGCQSKLWDLRKIYFGDIRKFFLNGPQGQPYMFSVEYESYDVCKQLFGDWDRWAYVPNTVVLTPEVSSTATYSAFWTLRPVSMNYVEIIRYYDPVANEFSLTLNGIEMMPILEKQITGSDGAPKSYISGFPLTAVSPSGAIPFAKFDLEPMHDFVYSKAQPAKMRVAADVENMLVKLMLGMMKQKAKPTMGNMSGRNFGPEITDPATVINDIRDSDLFPVLPNFQGAQPADFSFFELMKKELDKNSIERSFQGMDSPSPQDETATADMNNFKAQSLKVAALFDGITYGENQLAWLRTYNIARNWTKPIDMRVDQFKKNMENVYRTVSMPSEVSGGQKATKKIVFSRDTTRGVPQKNEDAALEDGRSLRSEKVHQEEMDAEKKNGGVPVRIAYLHPDQYASAKIEWFYSHVPVPNGSDPLAYMLFAKQINDATLFFGPQSLNVKRLKHKFAMKTGEDFDDWFLGDQELAQANAALGPGGAAPPNTMPNPAAKPGANTSAPPPGAPNPGGMGVGSFMQGKAPAFGIK